MTRNCVFNFVAAAFLTVTVLAPQFAAAGGTDRLSERDKAAAGDALIASKNGKWSTFRKHHKTISSPVLKKALSWHLFSTANSGASFQEISGSVKASGGTNGGTWLARTQSPLRISEA